MFSVSNAALEVFLEETGYVKGWTTRRILFTPEGHPRL